VRLGVENMIRSYTRVVMVPPNMRRAAPIAIGALAVFAAVADFDQSCRAREDNVRHGGISRFV